MSDPTQNAASEADVTSAEAAAPESASPEQQIAALEKALAESQFKAQESFDQFLRAKAEMENIRRRSAEDVLKAQKFGVEKIADALLAVKDSMDAALAVENTSVESFKTGVELTSRQLTNVFEKFSIKEENPVGAKFDPTRHQAIAALESDQPANTVINVMQKGYMLHERVLRPALVAVAKEKSAESPANS
ncbi:MAG: nucleotide exchange factor GrpE [Betaproteobacteria bacterium]|nr:nucleotide exchange factor GrpE [Betaproteobacteria bacterium]